MSEEKQKPLEQIHYESLRNSYTALQIALAGNMMPWDEIDDKRKEGAATAVQAVITEFLRRNREPVAWYEKAPNSDAWFLAYSCNPEAETKPLFASPQPLPSIKEIAECLCKDEGEPDLVWQDYTHQANAVLELLKGKK